MTNDQNDRNDDRLQRIEEKLTRALTLMEEMGKDLCEHLEADRIYQEKIDKHINGNGAPGMTVRVDRLEQDQRRQQWFMRAVWGTIIPSVTAAAWALFKGTP